MHTGEPSPEPDGATADSGAAASTTDAAGTLAARARAASAPLRRAVGTAPGRLAGLGLLGAVAGVGSVVALLRIGEPEPAAYPGEISRSLLRALIVTGALVGLGVVTLVVTRRRAPRVFPFAVRATWLVGAFGVVLGGNVALLAAVGWAHEKAGLDRLRSLGDVVAVAGSVTTPPGMSPLVLAIVVAIAGLAALTLLVPPVAARVGRGLRGAAMPVAVALVLVASLLFFGGRVEATAAHLRAQVASEEADLADVARLTGELLANEVAVRLDDKVMAALPTEYRDALTIDGAYGRFASGVAQLRSDLSTAKVYGVTDEDATALAAAGKDRLGGFVGDLGSVTPDPATQVATPGAATHPQIAAVAEAMRDGTSPEAFSVVEVNGVRYQLRVNAIDSAEIAQYLRAAGGDLPMAEPLLAAYAELFTPGLQAQVTENTEAVIGEALRLNADPRPLIERAARQIVDAIDVGPAVDRVRAQALELATSYATGATELTTASIRVNRAIGDVLIGRLGSANQNTVQAAASSFYMVGSYLSRAQVNRIVSLMRTGSRRWRTDVRPDPENAPHCIERTTITVRYYAAQAVAAIDSPYVSAALKSEAAQVQGDAVTVVDTADPGWICFEIHLPQI